MIKGVSCNKDKHHLSIYLFIYLWLYSPLLDLGHFFSFLTFYTVGRTPWMEDQPVARPMPTHKTAQTQNSRTQTLMLQVGFEPRIPVFKGGKDSSRLRPRGHCDRQENKTYCTIIGDYQFDGICSLVF
jgi:hypothetical protein